MGFLDDIFGVTKARKDLAAGRAQSEAALNAGADAARGQFDQAYQRFAPDAAAGDAARENLLAALGLSGAEAQGAYFKGFQNDPGFQATLDAGVEAIDQSAAARGGLFSGGTLKDLHSYGQRQQFSQFQDRLDRLSSLTALGSAARGSQAGVKTEVADLEFGLGQMKANKATDFANAMSKTRGQGLNNLINVAGTAARIFTA